MIECACERRHEPDCPIGIALQELRNPYEPRERRMRPTHGECPGCGSAEDEWCPDECEYLDPMDYR